MNRPFDMSSEEAIEKELEEISKESK